MVKSCMATRLLEQLPPTLFTGHITYHLPRNRRYERGKMQKKKAKEVNNDEKREETREEDGRAGRIESMWKKENAK